MPDNFFFELFYFILDNLPLITRLLYESNFPITEIDPQLIDSLTNLDPSVAITVEDIIVSEPSLDTDTDTESFNEEPFLDTKTNNDISNEKKEDLFKLAMQKFDFSTTYKQVNAYINNQKFNSNKVLKTVLDSDNRGDSKNLDDIIDKIKLGQFYHNKSSDIPIYFNNSKDDKKRFLDIIFKNKKDFYSEFKNDIFIKEDAKYKNLYTENLNGIMFFKDEKGFWEFAYSEISELNKAETERKLKQNKILKNFIGSFCKVSETEVGMKPKFYREKKDIFKTFFDKKMKK